MRGARYVSFERNEARLGLAWLVGKHGLREPIKLFRFIFFSSLFFIFLFVFTSSFTICMSEAMCGIGCCRYTVVCNRSPSALLCFAML